MNAFRVQFRTERPSGLSWRILDEARLSLPAVSAQNPRAATAHSADFYSDDIIRAKPDLRHKFAPFVPNAGDFRQSRLLPLPADQRQQVQLPVLRLAQAFKKLGRLLPGGRKRLEFLISRFQAR